MTTSPTLADAPKHEQAYQQGTQAYDSQDYETAFKLLLPLAEQGDARAQYQIGVMYRFSEGVKLKEGEAAIVHQEKAKEWFTAAAKQGNPDAQVKLADHILLFFENPKKATEALAWLEKAVAQDHAFAKCELADIYFEGITDDIASGTPVDKEIKPDPDKAIELLNSAAEQNSICALNKLSRIHQKGKYGIPVNLTEAHKWLVKTAELGNTDSMTMVGDNYANGHGVEQSDLHAYMWYHTASEITGDSNKPTPEMIAYGIVYVDHNAERLKPLDERMPSDKITEAKNLSRLWIDEHKPK
ncbi:tetratricopeptide repeat protein [Kiloniella spongiae]|nr:tetratricopeptide repeat protein [Kiloniella spongiae]